MVVPVTVENTSYEAVTWVYAFAALPLSYLDDSVSIEVCARIAKVDGERRAQGMLGASVRIGVESRGANAIL